MPAARMTGCHLVTLVAVLTTSAYARSVSKELLELNNHINTQFGFDYSNDEEYFNLIGVNINSEEGGERFSYEDIMANKYAPRNEKRNDEIIEYDDFERNDWNGIDEEFTKKKYTLPDYDSKREKSSKISSFYQDSIEDDEDVFGDDYNFQKNDGKTNIVVAKTNIQSVNKLDTGTGSDGKLEDDQIVNDYDETHEVNDEVSDEDEDFEEEEDDYDEDYDYEGDENEENDGNYYDKDKEGADSGEEYDNNGNNEADDYSEEYEDEYDYDEEEDIRKSAGKSDKNTATFIKSNGQEKEKDYEQEYGEEKTNENESDNGYSRDEEDLILNNNTFENDQSNNYDDLGDY